MARTHTRTPARAVGAFDTAPGEAAAVQRSVGRAVLLGLLSAIAGLKIGALLLYFGYGRAWHRRWGATDDEVARPLPGDNLLPAAPLRVTHAVTIQAPVQAVWPWLVQMGQGRGGFYSYTWVENLLKANIQNSRRIVPEWQTLAVGDEIRLAAPSDEMPGGISVPVVVLEPQRALVLHGDTRIPSPTGAPPPVPEGTFMATTWGFYLFPQGSSTRLVERWSADYTPSLANRLLWGIFLEAGAFVMQRKMLLEIRARAETLARETRSVA